jgi:hypothetical protein
MFTPLKQKKKSSNKKKKKKHMQTTFNAAATKDWGLRVQRFSVVVN